MVKVGCGALILRDKHILLLLRGSHAPICPNNWGGPGGLQEEGETLVQTAMRETNEEAGIQIPLSPDAQPFFSGTWPVDGRRVYYFLVNDTEIESVVLADAEAAGYGWFSYAEAVALPLSFLYREAIEKLREEGLL